MLDPPSSGTPFIILPGNSWRFMTRHILSMFLKSLPPYVLKSHESFTYVSPDVFLASSKSLVINALYGIVRVSFSAPNASQPCGAFLFVGRCWRSFVGWEPSALYVIDNQKRTIHLVPNLIICKGVGNHTPSNQLLINHLRILACQTCVSS